MQKQGKVIIEEFPPERVELNIEITHHPELIIEMQRVAAQSGTNDFAIMLGVVAAYCEVVVDGTYTQQEIDKLCTILTNRLREKRQTLLLPTPMIQTLQ